MISLWVCLGTGGEGFSCDGRGGGASVGSAVGTARGGTGFGGTIGLFSGDSWELLMCLSSVMALSLTLPEVGGGDTDLWGSVTSGSADDVDFLGRGTGLGFLAGGSGS